VLQGYRASRAVELALLSEERLIVVAFFADRVPGITSVDQLLTAQDEAGLLTAPPAGDQVFVGELAGVLSHEQEEATARYAYNVALILGNAEQYVGIARMALIGWQEGSR
jgi:hypothetical protein